MSPILLDLGFIKIYWYSVMILLGLFIGGSLIIKESKKFKIPEDYIINLILYTIVFGIIGARLYYVLFEWSYYSNNLLDIFKVWEGGLAIHGGIIFGLIVIIIYTRKYKVNTLRMLDIIVVGLIIAQAIGRWGNFFNSEAYGPITTSAHLKSLGIPEFGTPFTIKLVEDTKPTTFGELVKISGLSHGTDVWLGNAQELIKNNIVPFKETIGCRDDIMVYLMYRGVAPIKAFKIMEFVRKGKASKDPETWKSHVETMRSANIPEWFIDSCAKIKYMFPKAHAAAYVTSAFRIAWYKVHMPVYFYASWYSSKATDVDVISMIKGYSDIKSRLEDIQAKGFEASNKENGQAESLKIALEASARGIKFLPIDLYKSEATVWKAASETEIYPPFNAIEGLGDTVALNLVREREKGTFISIEDVQRRGKVSQTLIDKMKEMGILKDLPDSNQLSLF